MTSLFGTRHQPPALRRGFGMVELLIVLAVTAAITSVSLLYVSRSNERVDSDQLLATVRQIAREVREIYGSQPTLYASLTMDALANAGVVERSQMLNAFFLSTPNNSRLRVVSTTRGGITGGGFQIAIYSAPKGMCYSLVTQTTSEVASLVQVNGTTAGDSLVNDPVTAAEAGTLCQPNNNTIVLTGA